MALLKEQRQYVGEYWSDYLKEIQAFETGDSVVGTTWQVIKNNIKDKDVEVTLPEEGATAWNDTWMLSSQAKSPNCAYAWMDYILSPEANAQATEYFGEAPNSPQACEKTTDPQHCATFHAGDEEYAKKALVLAHAHQEVPRRPHRRRVHRLRPVDAGVDGDQGLTMASTVTDPAPAPALRGPAARPASRLLHRWVWLRLSLLLSAPLAWMVLVYVVALAALLITAFWSVDSLSSEIDRTWTLENFRTILENEVYRNVTVRTVGVALAVTVIDVAIALPIAFYMAKVASPRARRMLVVAVLTPLWASYLVKVFAWRVVLSEGGLAEWSGLGTPGYGLTAVVIAQAYIWLPYVILPIFAALERVPDSLLEAAGDLGAPTRTVVRTIVMPLLVPGIVAGAIFRLLAHHG
ncbi:extracellular solute-binding protein [Nocardioides convexus]|uniref:extracellular solute-binding protein n=1 Tax=Nocardioides convexus TaxID=2712224 RepID=UPI002418396F|nr:extracellular solute-binding protein [Nocardioides convexus]